MSSIHGLRTAILQIVSHFTSHLLIVISGLFLDLSGLGMAPYLGIGFMLFSHSAVRAYDVLCLNFPLFWLHRMQNSPQPFHGTQVTPVMLPTKSRPLGLASARRTELLFDPTYCTSIGWHLGTSGGGLVIASRLVAFYLVGSYAFILQQYHTNSHGPSVATLISTRLLV